MALTDFEEEVDLLRMHFDNFKRVEQEQPELAKQLDFAGYLQFMDTRFYQNERFNQLEQLLKDVTALKKAVLK